LWSPAQFFGDYVFRHGGIKEKFLLNLCDSEEYKTTMKAAEGYVKKNSAQAIDKLYIVLFKSLLSEVKNK
jgi:hypothetical protein